MSKKKSNLRISLPSIHKNAATNKKSRKKKKKTINWNLDPVLDVPVKSLSHQHVISEQDYIVFGDQPIEREIREVREVSQTQINQDNSQTIKSSRQPMVIELTGEVDHLYNNKYDELCVLDILKRYSSCKKFGKYVINMKRLQLIENGPTIAAKISNLHNNFFHGILSSVLRLLLTVPTSS